MTMTQWMSDEAQKFDAKTGIQDYIQAMEDDRRGCVMYSVVTLSEASWAWGKSRKAIMMRIYTGALVARLSGKVWLISVNSLQSVWGKPFKGYTDGTAKNSIDD